MNSLIKKIIIMGLFIMALTVTGCTTVKNIDGVSQVKIGKFQVYMINEAERDGNTAILVDIDESIINQFIPETGFKHSTNVFLIKNADQYILIDTGTGMNGVVIEKLKEIGAEPEKINAILITHLHGDHFGSLQKDTNAVFPNAKIYLSKNEYDFFTKTNINQGAVSALAPYESNIVLFEPSEVEDGSMTEILPGIIPIAAYGHTPGHTVFLIQDRNNSILIIGDLLHVALVQFANPQISATFDMDKPQAAVTRKKILDYAFNNNMLIGGMHIVSPGMGTLSGKNNAEGFVFKINE